MLNIKPTLRRYLTASYIACSTDVNHCSTAPLGRIVFGKLTISPIENRILRKIIILVNSNITFYGLHACYYFYW